MYAIKMDSEKELSTTIKGTIYQGEHNADTLIFVLPMEFDYINVADCTILLKYIVPGGKGYVEQLNMYPIPHNEEYLEYQLPITTHITKHCGAITLWLTGIDFENRTVFQSDTTEIYVKQHIKIEDHIPGKRMDFIDQLALKVQEMIAGVVDNLQYDDEELTLQLTANGAPVGDPIDVREWKNDDVIYFTEGVEPINAEKEE